MSQNPRRSMGVVFLSPLANSQLSRRPENWRNLSLFTSLAWPTTLRMSPLNELQVNITYNRTLIVIQWKLIQVSGRKDLFFMELNYIECHRILQKPGIPRLCISEQNRMRIVRPETVLLPWWRLSSPDLRHWPGCHSTGCRGRPAAPSPQTTSSWIRTQPSPPPVEQ